MASFTRDFFLLNKREKIILITIYKIRKHSQDNLFEELEQYVLYSSQLFS